MMPSMAARLMSFADVEYRQQQLAQEFADGRWGRVRRSRRRAARHAPTQAVAPATALVAAPARRATALPAAPSEPAASERTPIESTSLVDDRLPVG